MPGGFGTSTWGGLSITTTIESALPLGPHSVRVNLSGVPQHSSAFVVGDALCPSTWTITRADRSAALYIVAVEKITTLTYRIILADRLGSPDVTHTITTSTLRSEQGVLVVPPRSATFAGVYDVVPVPNGLSEGPIDFAAVYAGSNSSLPTGITIGSDGDYNYESGAALLNKLIIRRLTTPKGAFFHLPNYGFGLAAKSFRTPSSLLVLKQAIDEQVRLEPEVQTANSTLTLSQDGVLRVRIAVTPKPPTPTLDVKFSVGDDGRLA